LVGNISQHFLNDLVRDVIDDSILNSNSLEISSKICLMLSPPLKKSVSKGVQSLSTVGDEGFNIVRPLALESVGLATADPPTTTTTSSTLLYATLLYSMMLSLLVSCSACCCCCCLLPLLPPPPGGWVWGGVRGEKTSINFHPLSKCG
jgi:hypothetical protein